MNQGSSRTRLRMGVGLCALAAALSQTAPAQADEAEDLGKMVVSANRTETSIEQVGSSVTVITAEEIEKKQKKTLMDVIQDVPGVTINSRGEGKTSEFYIRGMPSKNIVVLVDGINVNETSTTGTMLNLGTMLASNIERVEVLRGNQSTLYGANASAGVISITTKTGKNSAKPFGGGASVEVGSYNTRRESGNVYGRVGRFYYGGSVMALDSHGMDTSRGSGPNENDPIIGRQMDLKVGADLIEKQGILDLLNVEALVRSSDYSADGDGTSSSGSTYLVDNGDSTVSRTRAGKFAVNADLWNGLLKNALSVAESRNSYDYYTDSARKNANGNYDGKRDKYEYQGTLTPVEDHTFVFGADHARESAAVEIAGTTAATRGRYKDSVNNDGLFANYQVELFDKSLTLTFGARQDDHETFGDETTYRTTASYVIPGIGTRIHSSYGTGFNAPTLSMLYHSRYGNAKLKPEETRGMDLGVEKTLLEDRLVLDVTGFKNNTRNEITTVTSGGVTKFTNLTSTRVFGVETSAKATLSKEFDLTASYTYQQPRMNSGTVSSTGIPIGGDTTLNNRPHHQFNATLGYDPEEIPDLRTWIQARAADWHRDNSNTKRGKFGGYTIWNLGADYMLFDGVSVYGRVENLLNKTYHTKGEYGQPGLSGYAGVRAEF